MALEETSAKHQFYGIYRRLSRFFFFTLYGRSALTEEHNHHSPCLSIGQAGHGAV